MSFLVNLFKNKTRQMNITICGLDGAGKTTLVKYLNTGQFVETAPTLGINHQTLHLPKLQLNVFDLGGQEDFRPMWHSVNEKSDGIVFVFDKTDNVRFEEAVLAFKNVVKSQVLKDVTVLVLLNKADMPEGINRTELIEKLDLVNLKYNWSCFETSAKSGLNVYESFKVFIDNLKEVLNVG
ncbi:MAG: ADP-ribosylation factor family protein [Candidatus Heimdallarchaeota archaeon]